MNKLIKYIMNGDWAYDVLYVSAILSTIGFSLSKIIGYDISSDSVLPIYFYLAVEAVRYSINNK